MVTPMALWLRPRPPGCTPLGPHLDPPSFQAAKTDPPKGTPLGSGKVPFGRVCHTRRGVFEHRAAAKRGEFRLELAKSRRIVPIWTIARTFGHRRGSRGGSNWSPPKE